MDTLTRLSELSDELNTAADKLNQQIADAEQLLKNLSLGIEIWCGKGDDVNGDGRQYVLGYGRLREKFARDGSWSLLVGELRKDRYPVEVQCRLRDASRAMRIALAPLIPRLLSEIRERAENLSKDLSSALVRTLVATRDSRVGK